MNLNDYIDSLRQSPLPQNPMAQIRTLAKELAGGVTYRLWSFRVTLRIREIDDNDPPTKRLIPEHEAIQTYLQERWDGYATFPDFTLLERMGYLSEQSADRFSIDYFLTESAFQLLEETEPTKIFISYRRSESSAFALLVMTMLKNAGLNPFLDLALVPGEDWSAGLKDRIESAEYFVLLVGLKTLDSTVVLDEINWAMESGKTIIPIWHNNFEYQSGVWRKIPIQVGELLSMTHTIRVNEENPLYYHTAVLELLNRLGYTP